MLCVQYTRTSGKRLTYDIEVRQDGSYLIRHDNITLRGGLPYPLRAQQNRWLTNFTLQGLERAKLDIEELHCMPEYAPPETESIRRHALIKRFKESNG